MYGIPGWRNVGMTGMKGVATTGTVWGAMLKKLFCNSVGKGGNGAGNPGVGFILISFIAAKLVVSLSLRAWAWPQRTFNFWPPNVKRP